MTNILRTAYCVLHVSLTEIRNRFHVSLRALDLNGEASQEENSLLLERFLLKKDCDE